jgi:L-histidine N-alpha-methyltransferase
VSTEALMQQGIQHLHDLEPSPREFETAVLAGLSAPRKSLPCKFFYDAAGSKLFDRICELPEYYPTRTELGILSERAGEMAALLGPGAGVVEFGSGSAAKVGLILAKLERPSLYVPVDISRGHLLAGAAGVARAFPRLRVAPVCADYTQRFELPAAAHALSGRLAGFFPGSTIGNFTAAQARLFLVRTRRTLGRGAVMLIGVDLRKDPAILNAAYDDAAGVTAAFNLNLLHRINRELDGGFDVSAFLHSAHWNAAEGRVEMHLLSRRAQRVRIGSRHFDFAEGESIHTENSYKYTVEGFRELAAAAGYTPLECWTDQQQLFSVHALQAE